MDRLASLNGDGVIIETLPTADRKTSVSDSSVGVPEPPKIYSSAVVETNSTWSVVFRSWSKGLPD